MAPLGVITAIVGNHAPGAPVGVALMHYSRRRYQGQRSVVAAWARSPPQPTDDALNISMNLSVLTKFWELYLAGVVGVPSQLSVIAVDVHGLCTPPAIEKSRAHGCKVLVPSVADLGSNGSVYVRQC